MDSDKALRSHLIRLASERPEFRPILLPLLRDARTASQDKAIGLYRDAENALNTFAGKWATFSLEARRLPAFEGSGSSLLGDVRERRLALESAIEKVGEAMAEDQGKQAGFSEPDPRGLMKQFQQMQAELAEMSMWAKTLSVGIKAVSTDHSVEGPLRDLQEAQEAMKKSIDALRPVVTGYYRSKLPQRVDPRTL